jgi:hypothetical protein
MILSSIEPRHYRGKVIPTLQGNKGFVLFTSLVKAVCKTDNKGEVSTRLWQGLEPKLVEDVDFKAVEEEGDDDADIYVSAKAIKILVADKKACKKTWGLFEQDGLTQLVRDMGGTVEESAGATAEGSNSQNKRKRAEIDEGGEDDELDEEDPFYLIQQREEMVKKREKLNFAQSALLGKREEKCLVREEKVSVRENEVVEKEENLERSVIEFKKKKKNGAPVEDMNRFLDSLISIATNFKAKVSSTETEEVQVEYASLTVVSSQSRSAEENLTATTTRKGKEPARKEKTPTVAPKEKQPVASKEKQPVASKETPDAPKEKTPTVATRKEKQPVASKEKTPTTAHKKKNTGDSPTPSGSASQGEEDSGDESPAQSISE